MSGPGEFDSPSPTGSAINIAATGSNAQVFTINADAVSTVDEDASLRLLSADGTAATNDDLVRLDVTVDADNEYVTAKLERSRNGAAYAEIAPVLHLGTSGQTAAIASSILLNAGTGAAATQGIVRAETNSSLTIQCAEINLKDSGSAARLFLNNTTVDTLAASTRITPSGGGNLIIGDAAAGSSAQKVVAVSTGVAPTTSPTDMFQMYSKDITAGNAAPHFRTENGDVCKVFKGAALTAADASTVDTTYGAEEAAVIGNLRTRLGEIEARLQALGLIA